MKVKFILSPYLLPGTVLVSPDMFKLILARKAIREAKKKKL
jgi:hypothetical protein